jgi:hypothetical protein
MILSLYTITNTNYIPVRYRTVQFTLASVIADILVRIWFRGTLMYPDLCWVCWSGSRNKEIYKDYRSSNSDVLILSPFDTTF